MFILPIGHWSKDSSKHFCRVTTFFSYVWLNMLSALGENVRVMGWPRHSRDWEVTSGFRSHSPHSRPSSAPRPLQALQPRADSGHPRPCWRPAPFLTPCPLLSVVFSNFTWGRHCIVPSVPCQKHFSCSLVLKSDLQANFQWQGHNCSAHLNFNTCDVAFCLCGSLVS